MDSRLQKVEESSLEDKYSHLSDEELIERLNELNRLLCEHVNNPSEISREAIREHDAKTGQVLRHISDARLDQLIEELKEAVARSSHSHT